MGLKTTDLRIGNYIYGVSDRVELISAVHENGLTTKTPHFDDYHTDIIKYYKPIPLTEEWLINFGFLQSMALTNYWSEDEEMNIFVYNEVIHYVIPLDHDGNFWKIKKLEYVHNLQNLYFALTGKDLTHQKIN